MSKPLAAGVDLGGTKIRTGLVDKDGRVMAPPVTVPTEADREASLVVANIVRCVDQCLAEAGHSREDLLGIGIGSPGPLDIENGIVLGATNLPTLNNYPLREKLREALSLPVELNNDANVFVLGEARGGAGRGQSIVFGVTLGTGFGAGLVIDGRIFNGATGTAAEVWNFKYGEGIIEDYISGRGLKGTYTRKTGRTLRPREIAEAARAGDADAIATFNEFGTHLGVALSYIVNVIDPGILVVGGSIANDWELFRDSMEASLRPNINEMPRMKLRVVPAELGPDAAVVGAAMLRI